MVILAADDQPIVLKSLTHILKESGFDVHGANNGQSAIDDFDTKEAAIKKKNEVLQDFGSSVWVMMY